MGRLLARDDARLCAKDAPGERNWRGASPRGQPRGRPGDGDRRGGAGADRLSVGDDDERGAGGAGGTAPRGLVVLAGGGPGGRGGARGGGSVSKPAGGRGGVPPRSVFSPPSPARFPSYSSSPHRPPPSPP